MEKAKFPMPTMDITQGYNEGTHLGAYALDMAGEDTGIDWVEAPFTGVIKHTESASYGNWYWFESLEPVLCANGEVTKLTCMFGHDNKMRHKVGDIIKQGEHLCVEGRSGKATGNHCHMEVGKGEYVGTWYPNQYGIYMIYNAVKPNEYLCLPDNYVIKNDGGYHWTRESEVKEPIKTQTLILPASADSWRIYPLDKAPVVGNELKNKLAPKKYGGLEYEIKGWSMPDVAIIDTQMFGRVQIYVAPKTGAIIK
jgi:murein DD-endopeptidase MepM/ murein hydrolase activator NlpD